MRGAASSSAAIVTSHKGVNLPGVPIPIPSLTRKDLEDLEFALELGCDFIALSFVRSAADVRDLKALIEQEGSTAHVIAKIEKSEAVDALDDVLAESDAVMVARGDLGVEIGPELVPLVQKRIIAKALERGKPVITATQMLESMIHHPEPTRAEASDVANAILDGTSAIMLSGETAMGEYPVQAVQTMDRIARAVEPSLGYRHQIPEATEDPTIGNAMSNAACDLAEALGAAAILVPTFTGRTASAVARLRPRRPIVALTHKQWSVHQMAIEWGVTPIWIPECKDVEDLVEPVDGRGEGRRPDRVGRHGRDHRRDCGQHPRLDERHQSRRSHLEERAQLPAKSAHMAAARTSRRPPTRRARAALAGRRARRGDRLRVLPPAPQLARDAARALVHGAPKSAQLSTEKRALQQRLEFSASAMRSHVKRDRLGYIRPGEHLFIVKGIQAWQNAHTLRSTVMESDRAAVERPARPAAARLQARRRPLSVRTSRSHRAARVRRQRRAFPDDVLAHVPVSSSRPCRGSKQRAVSSGGRARPPRIRTWARASSARTQSSVSCARARPRRRRRACAVREASSACTPTSPSRSHDPATRSGERILGELDSAWPHRLLRLT